MIRLFVRQQLGPRSNRKINIKTGKLSMTSKEPSFGQVPFRPKTVYLFTVPVPCKKKKKTNTPNTLISCFTEPSESFVMRQYK